MEELRKKALGHILDVGEANVKSARKQGSIDGSANLPESSALEMSAWETKFIDSCKEAWENFVSLMKVEKDRSISEFNDLTDSLARESTRVGETLGQRQKKTLDLLEAESGESSISYKTLKIDYEEKRKKREDVEKSLGRPLQVSLIKVYFPLMVLLALAEIPVNRLAFELFFESMPAVSLLLSGAVGCLFIFFAHIIGKQYRHTQCPVTSTNREGVYLAIFGLLAVSLLLMFFLGVMREQLVALQSGATLNLEDLSLDDLAKGGGADSNTFDISIGSKGIFLVLLNFMIFLAGVLASYFRHDPHPFLEKLTKDALDAKVALDSHMKSFEDRQIDILKKFNNELTKNEDEYFQREGQINEIKNKRTLVDRNLEGARQMLFLEVSRTLRAYREENLASRTSPPPEYFTENIDSRLGAIAG